MNKLIEGLNLPKILVDKTIAFLDRLLGPSVDEAGYLLADRIKFRRFRNQVKILQKSEELLESAGIEARQVPLQTLVPLIEKASLEEDPTLQEMWAQLIANAATSDARAGLHRLCVHILSSISPAEAKVLERVFGLYREERPELLVRMRKWNKARPDIHAELIFFRPEELFEHAEVSRYDIDLLLDNFIRLNLLRWETPEVEDDENVSPDFVHLTELGLNVIKECIGGHS
ncbi:MAG: Abi-alpha family protein [Candidatus Electrothrix sp. YB6]